MTAPVLEQKMANGRIGPEEWIVINTKGSVCTIFLTRRAARAGK
jgi:hypothetical protein